MAERRMFSKKVIDTDWFMDMPPSTQNLYFHLSMRADDDGFVSSPKRIVKIINATEDDYKLLIAKKFIIPFESGVCVITDWRINNYLRSDRYTGTIYQDEKKELSLDKQGKYNLGIPNGYQRDTQYSIGKDSIGKNSICKCELPPKQELGWTGGGQMSTGTHRFVAPSINEVKSYCLERKNNVDAERFVNFYASKGWMVGKNKMRDWKACVRTWERESAGKQAGERKYTSAELDELFDNVDDLEI